MSKSTKMHQAAKPTLFALSRELRGKQTEAEAILWEHLKTKKLGDFKFRRQHPINRYIVDFYCHQAKLVIELDGNYHERDGQRLYDEDRTENLKSLGLKEIRFKNEEVTNNLERVLEAIQSELVL
ncbi:MAG: DUF559 domain-containing protein [Saprospiraceae bacterium]